MCQLSFTLLDHVGFECFCFHCLLQQRELLPSILLKKHYLSVLNFPKAVGDDTCFV